MVRRILIAALMLATMGCGRTATSTPSPVSPPVMTPTPFLPAGFAGLPTGEVPENPSWTPRITQVQNADAVAEGTASPAVAQVPIDVAAVYETINRLREREGVPDLVVSPDLARLAHARALELALTQSLWHVQASFGTTPGEKMAQAGFSGALAEHVIAVAVGTNDRVGAVLQAWLTDATHRRDVLDPRFALTGLGVADDGRWLYLVQLLAENGPGG